MITSKRSCNTLVVIIYLFLRIERLTYQVYFRNNCQIVTNNVTNQLSIQAKQMSDIMNKIYFRLKQNISLDEKNNENNVFVSC